MLGMVHSMIDKQWNVREGTSRVMEWERNCLGSLGNLVSWARCANQYEDVFSHSHSHENQYQRAVEALELCMPAFSNWSCLIRLYLLYASSSRFCTIFSQLSTVLSIWHLHCSTTLFIYSWCSSSDLLFSFWHLVGLIIIVQPSLQLWSLHWVFAFLRAGRFLQVLLQVLIASSKFLLSFMMSPYLVLTSFIHKSLSFFILSWAIRFAYFYMSSSRILLRRFQTIALLSLFWVQIALCRCLRSSKSCLSLLYISKYVISFSSFYSSSITDFSYCYLLTMASYLYCLFCSMMLLISQLREAIYYLSSPFCWSSCCSSLISLMFFWLLPSKLDLRDSICCFSSLFPSFSCMAVSISLMYSLCSLMMLSATYRLCRSSSTSTPLYRRHCCMCTHSSLCFSLTLPDLLLSSYKASSSVRIWVCNLMFQIYFSFMDSVCIFWKLSCSLLYYLNFLNTCSNTDSIEWSRISDRAVLRVLLPSTLNFFMKDTSLSFSWNTSSSLRTLQLVLLSIFLILSTR